MAQVFISYVEEDADVATGLAHALEEAGLTTWFYTRDTNRPARSYLLEIAAAIEECQVLVVIISRASVRSHQMTNEIVRGFELTKPLVPVLRGLNHTEFQSLQPEWRGAFGAATSLQLPPTNPELIVPRLLGGLFRLGLMPGVGRPRSGPLPVPPPPTPAARPHSNPWQSAPPPTPPQAAEPSTRVELTATFDRDAYPTGDDPLAYCLAEMCVASGGKTADETTDDGPGADLALVLDVSGSMNRPDRYPLLCEAVRRLVSGLRPQDRVSVTLFSSQSATVVPFITGDKAARDPDAIIRAMNNSGLLFQNTMLAPGLRLALDSFGPGAAPTHRVRRTYILTDGELHDTPACVDALNGFRPRLAEVHAYGFGNGFNAAALKQLLSDQIGGTVKPIVNEEDIGKTFAHIAAVNRRLVGQNGKLSVTFAPEVVCGDAWVFKPSNRYLGRVRGQRVEYVIGGVEADRGYSLLLEVRLPPAGGRVGIVEVEWFAKDERVTQRLEVMARRGPEGQRVEEVRRALDVLHALRAGDDKEAQLASYKARRELAQIEGRDPNLIAALDKAIAGLTKSIAGQTVGSDERLTAEEDLYVEASSLTWVRFDEIGVVITQGLDRILGLTPRPTPEAEVAVDEFLQACVQDGKISPAAATAIKGQVRRGKINGETIDHILEKYPTH